MNFRQSVFLFYNDAFIFKKRTPRSCYNYALLFSLIFIIFIELLNIFTFGKDYFYFPRFTLIHYLNFFVGIPGISLSVRRLHDVGITGWLALLYLVPILGLIMQIILTLIKSKPGSNKWGPNPLDELEKDNNQPEINAESIWTKKETINTEQSDENYSNEMEEELQKVEDMYKKKTITSAERKKMRNKILNID